MWPASERGQPQTVASLPKRGWPLVFRLASELGWPLRSVEYCASLYVTAESYLPRSLAFSKKKTPTTIIHAPRDHG
jgi:hypothetical protein